MSNDVANKLTRKLGLKQTPGKDVMKEFAQRARAFLAEGDTVDQAAMKAATAIFPGEFKATAYAGVSDSMETILDEIEKL
jgi:hypothetical protein